MAHRRPLSTRVRLTLWYTAVLAAVLIAVSAVSYGVLRWSLLRDQDLSLLTVAQALSEAALAQARVGQAVFPDSVLRDLLGPGFADELIQLRSGAGAATLYSPRPDRRELPVSALAQANAAQGQRTFETLWLPGLGQVRLLTVPTLHDGQLVHLVQVGLPLRRTEQALRRYLQILLWLVPIGIGLAALGGSVIARNALRPVDAMSHAARRITAEDLAKRVPTTGAGDELDRLADTFNGMLARLEDAFAQMRRFAAEAAHELRTPLTALKGGIEVALRAERSPEAYRRILGSNLEEVERLIELAEDLLLFSRVTTALAVSREPVDLEAVLLEVADAGLKRVQGTRVTLRVGDLEPCVVRGDANGLRRAVMNLVDNAVRHTPDGGVVDIALRHTGARPLDLGGGEVVITVKDSGAGIDPADLDRIFEPFVRVHPERARDARGSGLGLSIARAIVTAHGGTITVSSTPGTGSEFVIRLPATSPPVARRRGPLAPSRKRLRAKVP